MSDTTTSTGNDGYSVNAYNFASAITTMIEQSGFQKSGFITDVLAGIVCKLLMIATPVKECRVPSDRIAPVIERIEGIASDILLRDMGLEPTASEAPECVVYNVDHNLPSMSLTVTNTYDGEHTNCTYTVKIGFCSDNGEDITDREPPDYSFTTLEDK